MSDPLKDVEGIIFTAEDVADYVNEVDEHWKSQRRARQNASGGDAMNAEVEPDGDIIVIDGVTYKKV